MGVSGGPYIVRDSSLVLELDAADRNSYVSGSSTWFDLTANNNTGSLTNGPTFSSGSGGSIMFDGTNDSVNLGNPNSLNITGSLTLSSWIRMTSWNNYPAIISKGYDETGGYSMHIRDNYSIWFEIYTNSRQFYNPTDLKISLNSWFNVVCTYDQTQMRIHINGTAAGNGNPVSGLIRETSSNMIIGILPSYGFFNGLVSNIQIYNRALPTQEILQNYNALKSRFNL